jgi:hypothetical protein
MISSIPSQLAQTIKNEADPKKVWDAIIADFEDQGNMYQINIRRQLLAMKCQEDGDVKVHLTEMT